MSAYDDIKYLRDKGVWPNAEVPGWAAAEAQQLDCHSTHVAVLQRALMREVEQLRSELTDCKTALAQAHFLASVLCKKTPV